MLYVIIAISGVALIRDRWWQHVSNYTVAMSSKQDTTRVTTHPQRYAWLILGLKRIVILVFEYSFGFQTNIPNILFTRRSGKMAILCDKMTMSLVE